MSDNFLEQLNQTKKSKKELKAEELDAKSRWVKRTIPTIQNDKKRLIEAFVKTLENNIPQIKEEILDASKKGMIKSHFGKNRIFVRLHYCITRDFSFRAMYYDDGKIHHYGVKMYMLCSDGSIGHYRGNYYNSSGIVDLDYSAMIETCNQHVLYEYRSESSKLFEKYQLHYDELGPYAERVLLKNLPGTIIKKKALSKYS